MPSYTVGVADTAPAAVSVHRGASRPTLAGEILCSAAWKWVSSRFCPAIDHCAGTVPFPGDAAAALAPTRSTAAPAAVTAVAHRILRVLIRSVSLAWYPAGPPTGCSGRATLPRLSTGPVTCRHTISVTGPKEPGAHHPGTAGLDNHPDPVMAAHRPGGDR